MAIWGGDTWGTSLWGGAGSPDGFTPVVIQPRPNTSNITTVVYLHGATVDLAFDMTFSFDLIQDETITSSTWTTDDPDLQFITSVDVGVVAVGRLLNNLSEGKSSTAFCSMTTSLGRTLNESIVVVSELG